MNPQAILPHIERILERHDCTPDQRQLARSLSLAGALASVLNCTPKELLHDLTPAFELMRQRELVDVEVQ